MDTNKVKLEKAQVYEVDEAGKGKRDGVGVECMFNPFEYTVSKTNSYTEDPKNNSDTPQFQFTKAGAQTLRLSLTFDTYEQDTDVSRITSQLWKLMESKTRNEGNKNKKVPPPEVAFHWGVFHFIAVITDMTQKFTMFRQDGMPVRAKVDVTFTQHKDVNDYPGQNPTSGGGPIERVRQIVAGDRLDLIAAEVYRDATKWRLIAERNKIDNPLALRPGQQLMIPED
jgi:hypothetical protein